MHLATIADLNGSESDVTQYIGIAKELSSLYDDFLENMGGNANERAPGIHASELCGCLRKVGYSLSGTKPQEDISAQWRKRFEVGHAVHAMVQRHFHKMAARLAGELAKKNGWYVEFADEVPIAPDKQALAKELSLASSCDGVFTFLDAYTKEVVLRVGLEIKTESPNGYEALRSPKDYHVEQAHVYMAALDLPLMWFFYFNKGNQNNTTSSAPWLIPFNPAIWQKLEMRAHTALDNHANNVTAPREEGVGCQFCSYSWTCQPKTQRSGQKQVVPLRVPTKK